MSVVNFPKTAQASKEQLKYMLPINQVILSLPDGTNSISKSRFREQVNEVLKIHHIPAVDTKKIGAILNRYESNYINIYTNQRGYVFYIDDEVRKDVEEINKKYYK
jgi:hypothetical protein